MYVWMSGCEAMCSLIEWTAYQACRLNSSITRRGQEVWQLILHKVQACLWWFRQTVALATCRETEMVGCGRGRILRQQGLFPLCLNRQFPLPQGSKQIHKGSKEASEAWQWDSSGAASLWWLHNAWRQGWGPFSEYLATSAVYLPSLDFDML